MPRIPPRSTKQYLRAVALLIVLAVLPFSIAQAHLMALTHPQESLVFYLLIGIQFLLGFLALFLLSRIHAQATSRSERDRLKRETLTMLNHEFRTPATFLIGGIHLLRDPGISEVDRQMLVEKLEYGINRLMRLINSFLSLNDILYSEATEAFYLHRTEFTDWQGAIDHILPRYHTHLQEKDLEVRVVVSVPVPPVCAFHLQIEEIISHLLENAIKFTKVGSIQVLVFQDGRGVRCEISDTGTGIPGEHLDTIFEPFTQVGRDQQEQQGSGLGLAITKGLVEIAGGRLEVRSWSGKGSVFSFWLPEAKE